MISPPLVADNWLRARSMRVGKKHMFDSAGGLETKWEVDTGVRVGGCVLPTDKALLSPAGRMEAALINRL